MPDPFFTLPAAPEILFIQTLKALGFEFTKPVLFAHFVNVEY